MCSRGKVKVADVATKCGLSTDNVSRNHAFLISIGVLHNGRDKQLTDDGINLSIAVGNNDGATSQWKKILQKNSVIKDIIDLFKIQGDVSVENFPKRIATILSESVAINAIKTGISHLIELLEYSEIIARNENVYVLLIQKNKARAYFVLAFCISSYCCNNYHRVIWKLQIFFSFKFKQNLLTHNNLLFRHFDNWKLQDFSLLNLDFG